MPTLQSVNLEGTRFHLTAREGLTLCGRQIPPLAKFGLVFTNFSDCRQCRREAKVQGFVCRKCRHVRLGVWEADPELCLACGRREKEWRRQREGGRL